MAKNGTPTTKKALAIAALMSSKSVVDAAKAAGVGHRTLHTWLLEPEFRQALTNAEGVAIDAATRRLVSLAEASVAVIASIMADRNVSPGVRLRAASEVLNHLLKLRELRDIEARLLALEGAHHESD
jgi:hypothetical protein